MSGTSFKLLMIGKGDVDVDTTLIESEKTLRTTTQRIAEGRPGVDACYEEEAL
jgi:hypothetical protein